MNTGQDSLNSRKDPQSRQTQDRSMQPRDVESKGNASGRQTSDSSLSLSIKSCPSLPQLTRSGTLISPSLEPQLQIVREQIKDRLSRKQEVIPLPNGMYMHRCHIVLITLVNGLPLSTHLTVNVKSKKKESRIVLDGMCMDGRRVYQRS